MGNIAVLVKDRLKTLYHTFVPVYTDGPEHPHSGKTGFAFRIPALQVSVKRSSDHLCVYTVKMMMAVLTPLLWIEKLKMSFCVQICVLH